MIYLAEMEECVWCEKEHGWFGTRKPQNVSCNHCDRFIHRECLTNIGKPMSSQEYELLLKSHEGFEYTCDDCVPTNGKLIFILNLLYEVQYFFFPHLTDENVPPVLKDNAAPAARPGWKTAKVSLLSSQEARDRQLTRLRAVSQRRSKGARGRFKRAASNSHNSSRWAVEQLAPPPTAPPPTAPPPTAPPPTAPAQRRVFEPVIAMHSNF